ncbi:dehydrogenase/reductase member 7 [Cryptosporidium ryanae]|uniref:dehydrogenase/reductase member 7 n=1 Tax=Cryptosporidium ryanae TaxID=515981 RepID=UPI003519DD92|nr:dehydrogenase/reductase member 7 [Cryptosporidium ryanae]
MEKNNGFKRQIFEIVGVFCSILYAIPVFFWSFFVATLRKDSDFVLGCLSDEISHDYFRDKVIWITGSSSGIGKSLAIIFSELSVNYKIPLSLILTSRSSNVLSLLKSELVEKIGIPEENILILSFDIGDISVIDSKVEEAINWKGRIDIFYNNAGVGQKAILGKFESDKKVMMVNLLGPMMISRLLLHKCFIPQKYGHLINTLSIQAYIPLPGRCSYGASKRANLSFFQSLRMELEGINWDDYLSTEIFKNEIESRNIFSSSPEIVITNIYPGHVKTEFDVRNIIYDGSSIGGISNMNGMNPRKCAELMIKSTTNKLKEVWIARGFELVFTYISYYSPNVSKLISDILNKKFVDKVWELEKSHLKKST